MTVSLPRTPSLANRLTAIGAAALVMALTVLASSPQLHAWLHGHEAAKPPGHAASHAHPFSPEGLDDDDGCVVTLFAQGIVAGAIFFLTDRFTLVRPERIRVPEPRLVPSRSVFAHARSLAPPRV